MENGDLQPQNGFTIIHQLLCISTNSIRLWYKISTLHLVWIQWRTSLNLLKQEKLTYSSTVLKMDLATNCHPFLTIKIKINCKLWLNQEDSKSKTAAMWIQPLTRFTGATATIQTRTVLRMCGTLGAEFGICLLWGPKTKLSLVILTLVCLKALSSKLSPNMLS